MEIKAVIHDAEEGGYWAEVPELPGCITEGDTLDELKAKIADAAIGWLEAQLQGFISYQMPKSRRKKKRAPEAALA